MSTRGISVLSWKLRKRLSCPEMKIQQGMKQLESGLRHFVWKSFILLRMINALCLRLVGLEKCRLPRISKAWQNCYIRATFYQPSAVWLRKKTIYRQRNLKSDFVDWQRPSVCSKGRIRGNLQRSVGTFADSQLFSRLVSFHLLFVRINTSVFSIPIAQNRWIYAKMSGWLCRCETKKFLPRKLLSFQQRQQTNKQTKTYFLS